MFIGLLVYLGVVWGAPLDFFVEFSTPEGLFIDSDSSLDATYVHSPQECATLCLKYPQTECISFSYIPDFKISNYSAFCLLNGWSITYAQKRGGRGGYYHRLRGRDDRPWAAKVLPKLKIPQGGVSVQSGIFRDVIDGEIYYLVNYYQVDDILYWYRKRAGMADPPGESHGWDNLLQGSISGLFLMGAGGILRWEEHTTLREMLEIVVDEIGRLQEEDGFFSAYPRDEVVLRENPNYVTAWQTYGFIAADKAGHPDALRILRSHLNWFNNNSYLPLFLPPNGGPVTQSPDYYPIPPGYPNTTGNPDGANQPSCSPYCVNHHLIYLQYQGMIKHTQMALSRMGTFEDINIVEKLYKEDWWLSLLIARDEKAVWKRNWYPHNYELTAFEAYLDMYFLTGNQTYLEAVLGGWDLFSASWIHVGGSIALNEQSWYPPKSYFLGHHNSPTGELCGSSFWIKLNQRLHTIYPDNEDYVAEMERSLYNILFAGQGVIYEDGKVIRGGGYRYFQVLHGKKWDPWTIGTCCEGQAARQIGSLPEYFFTVGMDNTIYVDIYFTGTFTTNIKGSTVTIVENYLFPGANDVNLTVASSPVIPLVLKIRIPKWVLSEVIIYVDDVPVKIGLAGSYVTIPLTQNGKISFSLVPSIRFTKYIGVDQIPDSMSKSNLPRYAYEYGPVLLAVIGYWNSSFVAPNTDYPGCISLSGIDPEQPENWLIRTDSLGYSVVFSVANNEGTFLVPYYEIQEEQFTVYPVFLT